MIGPLSDRPGHAWIAYDGPWPDPLTTSRHRRDARSITVDADARRSCSKPSPRSPTPSTWPCGWRCGASRTAPSSTTSTSRRWPTPATTTSCSTTTTLPVVVAGGQRRSAAGRPARVVRGGGGRPGAGQPQLPDPRGAGGRRAARGCSPPGSPAPWPAGWWSCSSDVVNPSIASHGGRADLVALDEEGGVAYLRLSGGCQGCAMSRMTLTQGIEMALRDEVPEVVTGGRRHRPRRRREPVLLSGTAQARVPGVTPAE